MPSWARGVCPVKAHERAAVASRRPAPAAHSRRTWEKPQAQTPHGSARCRAEPVRPGSQRPETPIAAARPSEGLAPLRTAHRCSCDLGGGAPRSTSLTVGSTVRGREMLMAGVTKSMTCDGFMPDAYQENGCANTQRFSLVCNAGRIRCRSISTSCFAPPARYRSSRMIPSGRWTTPRRAGNRASPAHAACLVCGDLRTNRRNVCGGPLPMAACRSPGLRAPSERYL